MHTRAHRMMATAKLLAAWHHGQPDTVLSLDVERLAAEANGYMTTRPANTRAKLASRGASAAEAASRWPARVAGYLAAAWDSDSEGSEDEAQPQDAEEESEGKESPPPQQRTRRAQRSAAGSSAGVVSYTVSLQSQVVRSDPYNHYTLLYPSLACARRAARVPAGLPRAAAGAWACRPGARLGLRSADWPRAACRVRLSSLFTLFLGSHRISGQGSSIL